MPSSLTYPASQAVTLEAFSSRVTAYSEWRNEISTSWYMAICPFNRDVTVLDQSTVLVAFIA